MDPDGFKLIRDDLTGVDVSRIILRQHQVQRQPIFIAGFFQQGFGHFRIIAVIFTVIDVFFKDGRIMGTNLFAITPPDRINQCVFVNRVIDGLPYPQIGKSFMA